MSAPPARVLGCRVDAVTTAEAVERIIAFAKGATPKLVVTVGTEMAVRARSDAAFRRALDGAALALCDTVGVQLAARVYGRRIAQRVTGIDLIDPLCAALAREGLALYLIGSKGDTAQRAARALLDRHPLLQIAGARDGYFRAEESAAVAAEMRASGASVVLAGLGSPRQELWLEAYLAQTGCRVGIGVGGSLDVLAGNVRRAPASTRRLGLEWLYRLVSEPSRWRRQLALPQFVWLVAVDRARSRESPR